MIGIFVAILAWQTVKNGKVFKENFAFMKEHFVRMDERFIKLDERAEQRHWDVVQLMKQQHDDVIELLKNGFGTIITGINEIKTK